MEHNKKIQIEIKRMKNIFLKIKNWSKKELQ
jgi:hypothetical protein